MDKFILPENIYENLDYTVVNLNGKPEASFNDPKKALKFLCNYGFRDFYVFEKGVGAISSYAFFKNNNK